MRKFYFILLIIFSGCGQAKKSMPLKTNADTLSRKNIPETLRLSDTEVSSPTSNISLDSLMKDYLLHSKKALVRLAMRDKEPEEWLFDQVITTDTAVYFTYQVGHDFTNEDGKRFVTDQWMYIDTLKKQLYEYDVGSDTLVKWNR